MKPIEERIKLFSIPIVFILLFSGRAVNLLIVSQAEILDLMTWGLLYSLIISLLLFFVLDLVFAKGLLEAKIQSSKILLLLFLFSIIGQTLIFPRIAMDDLASFSIVAISVAITSLALLVRDFKSKYNKDYRINESEIVPKSISVRHPLRIALGAVFRLFPLPISIGFFRIGKPGNNSPIYVTGNFHLTARRVIESIKGFDCWLLICDSRGINIWCSSLANHFNEDKIIEAMKIFSVEEKTQSRTLILPQLCAGNVNTKKIAEQTGFKSKFGPVDIRLIETYLDNPKDPIVRKRTFNLKERLEMGFGTIIFPLVLLALVYNFLGLSHLLVLVPAAYLVSIINSMIYPFRPIKNTFAWALVLSVLVFGLSMAVFSLFETGKRWMYSITLGLTTLYSVAEFEGWSPLVKYSPVGAHKKPKASVNLELCNGCGLCVSVCPRAVYSIIDNKSKIVDLDSCISCKACYVQCPEVAIDHSSKKIKNSLV